MEVAAVAVWVSIPNGKGTDIRSQAVSVVAVRVDGISTTIVRTTRGTALRTLAAVAVQVSPVTRRVCLVMDGGLAEVSPVMVGEIPALASGHAAATAEVVWSSFVTVPLRQFRHSPRARQPSTPRQHHFR